jgi:uncharacterized protein YjiS (DUF1127 family)
MLFHEIAKRLRERVQISREIRRVRALDDRLLADIGVARKEIAAYVRGEC